MMAKHYNAIPSNHPSLGPDTKEATLVHCGRCKNPFMSNPACECGCHTKTVVGTKNSDGSATFANAFTGGSEYRISNIDMETSSIRVTSLDCLHLGDTNA